MPHEAGYLASPTTPVGLSNTWVSMKLSAIAGLDRCRATPNDCLVGDVGISLSDVVTAVSIQLALTYTSGVTLTMAGPSGTITFASLSSGTAQASFTVNVNKTWPHGSTAGECYLWAKLDAGTANVIANGARLQWRDMIT